MDYNAWRSSKTAHSYFKKEEKEDYYGKPRKAKIFMDAVDDEEVRVDCERGGGGGGMKMVSEQGSSYHFAPAR